MGLQEPLLGPNSETKADPSQGAGAKPGGGWKPSRPEGSFSRGLPVPCGVLVLRALQETVQREKSVLSSDFVLSKTSSSHPGLCGETEAKKNDHLEPGSWLPGLDPCTLLAALATPEQVRGTLATSRFSGAKPEPGRRGRGCVCVGWEEGERLRSPGQGGGARSGVGMPQARGGAAALSAVAEPPGSSAPAEPQFLARPLR